MVEDDVSGKKCWFIAFFSLCKVCKVYEKMWENRPENCMFDKLFIFAVVAWARKIGNA